jgi:putative DNA primase/helicase
VSDDDGLWDELRRSSPNGKPVEFAAVRGDLAAIRRTRWAWAYWAPLGAFVVIAGEPSAGKGVLTSYLIAQFTTGQAPGDLEGEPVNVLWIGNEDGWEDQVLPRFAAAGADVERTFNLRVTTPGGYLDLRRDQRKLAELVQREEIKVIAFEAIVDHLDGVDDHKNAEVRRGLAPAVEIARERQLLVLGTTHLNKMMSGGYRHRVAGSGGYLAVARAGWLVHRHPENPELRVLAFGKGNLGQWPDSMVFAIEGADVPNPSNDEVADVGRVAADPEPYFDKALDVDTVLAGPKSDHGSREEDVAEFLPALLADGPMRSTDVYAEGKKRGFSEVTLRRHKDAAGARVVKKADGWYWEAAR